MALLVCRTCPRHDTAASGTFAAVVSAALQNNARGAAVTVRYVQCLGGCPDHSVAAVDGPGQARVRFTGLTAHHADALVIAAHLHNTSPSGAPGDWTVPAELQNHLSSITRKRCSHADQVVANSQNGRASFEALGSCHGG